MYLNVFFLMVICVSVLLVNVFGVLSYDDHWWDVTVPIAFFASIMAGIFGGMSLVGDKQRSIPVYASVFVSLLAILFILTHSAFIND